MLNKFMVTDVFGYDVLTFQLTVKNFESNLQIDEFMHLVNNFCKLEIVLWNSSFDDKYSLYKASKHNKT